MYWSVRVITNVKENDSEVTVKKPFNHRTMKNVIRLDNYNSSNDLIHAISEFVEYYNNKRYHESLNNLRPADVYFGKDQQILYRKT